MSALEIAVKILASSLQVDRSQLTSETEVAGNFPEFNSLTIVNIIVAIEEELDCTIEDDEISTEIFETVGALAAFIDTKAE